VGPPDWTDESYYLFIIARRCFAHSNSRRRRGQANLKLSINHEGLHRGAQLQFVFSNIAWRSERFGGRQRLQAPTSVHVSASSCWPYGAVNRSRGRALVSWNSVAPSAWRGSHFFSPLQLQRRARAGPVLGVAYSRYACRAPHRSFDRWQPVGPSPSAHARNVAIIYL
jgi:hypothetical protein